MNQAPTIVRWINTTLWLFLIPWPFLSYIVIFASDSPSNSQLKSFAIQLLIYATWAYPIFYFIGRKYVERAVTAKYGIFRILAPFTPAIIIAAFYLLFFVRGIAS
ncbi:MAG: hypothetical protein SynsKO_25390 [Synoicihabitans sp.]